MTEWSWHCGKTQFVCAFIRSHDRSMKWDSGWKFLTPAFFEFFVKHYTELVRIQTSRKKQVCTYFRHLFIFKFYRCSMGSDSWRSCLYQSWFQGWEAEQNCRWKTASWWEPAAPTIEGSSAFCSEPDGLSRKVPWTKTEVYDWGKLSWEICHIQ